MASNLVLRIGDAALAGTAILDDPNGDPPLRLSAASSATAHAVESAAGSVESGARNAASSAWKSVSSWL